MLRKAPLNKRLRASLPCPSRGGVRFYCARVCATWSLGPRAAERQLLGPTLRELQHFMLEPGLDLRPFQNLMELSGLLRIAADVQHLLLPPSVRKP